MNPKYNLIISDYVLNRQVCDYCHKFLSVIPIKVYPNRRIKCGRCSTNNENNTDIGVYSMYNQIATRILFKCVNRFDGCTQLLQSSEVIEHEKTCISKKYFCPICSEEIFTFLIIRHFKLNHPHSILETTHFQLEDINNIKKHFLYQLENYLFFVNFSDISKSIVDDMRKFSLTIQHLGETGYIKSCKVDFHHFGSNISGQSSSKMIFSSSMTFHINLNVTNESKLLVMFYLNILEPKSALVNMMHCNTPQNNSDFHVQVGHVTGEDLKKLFFRKRTVLPNENLRTIVSDLLGGENSTLKFTKSGEKFKIRFSCDCALIYPSTFKINKKDLFLLGMNNDCYIMACIPCSLSNFNGNMTRLTPKRGFLIKDLENVLYFCNWGCGTHLNYLELYKHERNCKNQILQKCPIDACFCHFKLYEFENHFKHEHSLVIFPSIDLIKHDRFEVVSLDTAKLVIEHVSLVWCVCVLIKFKWEQHKWKITLTCEMPDIELKAIIYDSYMNEISKITANDSIPSYPIIRMALYLSDTK
ncbi:unnamed protein product [Psylliodes chrysocephalus]|uniref:SIAH-type domain-containing protein n=1 Tax=Psylliodes chrysocephalus TaxID=3402493 RepID=A0A9P0CQC3_9CUCU|nr:unnamed protein product [Psylliodes chrysocephala]